MLSRTKNEFAAWRRYCGLWGLVITLVILAIAAMSIVLLVEGGGLSNEVEDIVALADSILIQNVSSTCNDFNPCTADIAVGSDGLLCQNLNIINGAPCEDVCLKNITMDLHKICVSGECRGVCGGSCNVAGAECPDIAFHPATTALNLPVGPPICYLGQCVYSIFNVTLLMGANPNVDSELARTYSDNCLGLLHSSTIEPVNACVTKSTWSAFTTGGDACLYSFGCSDVNLPYFYLNPNASFVPSTDTLVDRAWDAYLDSL